MKMAVSSLCFILVTVLVQYTSATYYCGPPDPLRYGTITPQKKSYPVGARVEFSCNKGFILVGQRWTVCVFSSKKRSADWAHPTPVCKPVIRCPPLSDPRYGSVRVSGNRPGARAYYKCNPGFKLVGASLRKCQRNGKWSGEAPVCRPILCSDLDDPKYGSVSLSGRRIGSTATYKCNTGFYLVGQSVRKCQLVKGSGVWSGSAPVCRPIICPGLDNPQYGTVTLSGNRVGDTATYKCNPGFYRQGGAVRTCEAKGAVGVWSGKAPVCLPIKCPDLEDPTYGSVTLSGNMVGDTATYTCNSGFYLVGQSVRTCGAVGASGVWGGSAPICRPITCPDLDDPKYGTVTLSGIRVGSTATYTCNSGFYLVGESVRTCEADGASGVWSGSAPTCAPILCPDLEDPKYGTVTVSGNRVGYTAIYKCDFGFYLRGGAVRTCEAKGAVGVWSGKAPVCVPITCPDLEDPQYGSVTVSGNRVGATATYECDDGFKLVGRSVRTCRVSGAQSGAWSGTAPVCRPILCSDLDDPKYGSVKLSGRRLGSTATYRCNSGFYRVGQKVRTCENVGGRGVWSGKAPVCRPIVCPNLDDPNYGTVTLSGNRVGDTATYKCNTGFKLVGQSVRTCGAVGASGVWSGSAPVCIPILCSDLDDPKYGSVKLSGRRIGSTATYRCNTGFRLVGRSVRKCTLVKGNGVWSGKAPVCRPIFCPRLSNPKYGLVRVSGNNRPGAKADYKCFRGFKLVGNPWRKCQSNGKWTGSAPTCRRVVNCGKPPSPRYGWVKFSSTSQGAKATYFCKRGFVLRGSRVRVCQGNGNWSGKTPWCARIHYG